jgi:hypothetical protein
MSWVRLDDNFFTNPKVLNVSNDSKLQYLASLTQCSKHMTDGYLSRAAVRVVGALVDVDADRCVAELVDAGLWHAGDGGYFVHDYLKYNPSREEVRRQREGNARRQANWKTHHAKGHNAVTNGVSHDVINSAPSHPGPSHPGPSRPGNDVHPQDAETATVVAVATTKSVEPRAPQVELSETARTVLEAHRHAHGKRTVPKVNPIQAAKLEKALDELGLERLLDAVRWSAEAGVPEFPKCLSAAYTKRQRDEQAGGNGRGATSQRVSRDSQQSPGDRSAGPPARANSFAKYDA